MTATALVFLVTVWGVILYATGYCFWKLMRSDRQFDASDDS